MNYFKDIIIGITGGLITFCITSTLTETWDIQLPLWIWSIVFVGVFGLGYAIYCLFLWYRVRRIISEFTESAFGDSFVYTWKYKKAQMDVIVHMDTNRQRFAQKNFIRNE